MLKNQILTAEKPADLFGSTVDESELKAYADNLRNLFRKSDPDRDEALAKIDALLKQRDFDTARVIPGGVKVRKSPYKVLQKLHSSDNIVVHAAEDKRGDDRRFIFSSNPSANSVLMQANDNITTIRASVTKRNRVNFPEVLDTFFLTSKTGHKMLATIHNEGKGTPLSSLTDTAFADDDIAHIYREMIETLRKTHEAGVIHGACFLDSWLSNHETGNLVLTDWKYSVTAGEQMWKLPEALVERGLYLSKTVNSAVPNRETDIRLASYAAYSLTGDNNSPWLRKYLKSMGDYPFDSAKQILKEFSDTYRNKQLGIDEDTLLSD